MPKGPKALKALKAPGPQGASMPQGLDALVRVAFVFLFRNLGHDCLCRKQKPGDRRRILKGLADDLGRIDNACLH